MGVINLACVLEKNAHLSVNFMLIAFVFLSG